MTEQQHPSSAIVRAAVTSSSLPTGTANRNTSSSSSTSEPHEGVAQDLSSLPRESSARSPNDVTSQSKALRAHDPANPDTLGNTQRHPLQDSAFVLPSPAPCKEEAQVTGEEGKKEEEKRGQPRRPRRAAFVRRQWNKREDGAISALVREHGTKQWSMVARLLGSEYGIIGRTGKQCRERYSSLLSLRRWHNHLDPELNKDPLTPEEEQLIFEGQKECGNRWADISKRLPGRTDNFVKNYYYSTLRRQLRKIAKYAKDVELDEPDEITIEYIQQLMKKYEVPRSVIDNENVLDLLDYVESHPQMPENKDGKLPLPTHTYSL
jgi:hypothetical protein